MLDLHLLEKKAREIIDAHPELEDEVNGLLDLCKSEIEDGGSPSHEVELALASLDDLIGNDETD